MLADEMIKANPAPIDRLPGAFGVVLLPNISRLPEESEAFAIFILRNHVICRADFTLIKGLGPRSRDGK